MKILFTGGGTGGHFYPLIAIAEKLRVLIKREKLIDVQMYYMSDDPFDERLLFENGITFKELKSGKMRRYVSVLNIIDIFKTIGATFKAIFKVYSLYPDVVVSKGGGASFPVLFAARLLRIPVIIHESDSVPGRTNKWASKFAKKIAISYPQAAQYFPAEKTALTGQPIREEVLNPLREGAYELLKLEEGIPTILVLGGSQGAQALNEAMLQIVPTLVKEYQVIHQVGEQNVDLMKKMAGVVLEDSEHSARYRVFPYLNDTSLRMAGGIADLVVSRAGSTIFEIAAWGIPSIIIPLPNSAGNHQRKNAFSYARAGAATVIEERNLTPNILAAAIDGLMKNPEERESMSSAAKEFSSTDAAEKIAEQVVQVLISHQK